MGSGQHQQLVAYFDSLVARCGGRHNVHTPSFRAKTRTNTVAASLGLPPASPACQPCLPGARCCHPQCRKLCGEQCRTTILSTVAAQPWRSPRSPAAGPRRRRRRLRLTASQCLAPPRCGAKSAKGNVSLVIQCHAEPRTAASSATRSFSQCSSQLAGPKPQSAASSSLVQLPRAACAHTRHARAAGRAQRPSSGSGGAKTNSATS